MKIDAVIPWVDGNDPVLNAKRSRYTDAKAVKLQDQASPTRFSNLGELLWCVASLNKFAPFINRIYIITDGQQPELGQFAEGHIPVEVVDHKTIFRGYEEYLPVFNSISIETLIWNIPELSEHFLLLNDDFILVRPVSQRDFFPSEDSVICYGDPFNTLWAKILRFLKPRPGGHRVATFKSTMINAADLCGGCRKFFYLRHTPRPMLKSFFENYYSGHPEDIVRNIKFRFRDVTQYSNQELLYLMAAKEGRCEVRRTGKLAFFLQPGSGKKAYVSRKLEKLRKGDYMFCCFNSLDLATQEEQKEIFEWADGLLGL